MGNNWASRTTRHNKISKLAKIYGWFCHYCGITLTSIDEIIKIEHSHPRTWKNGIEYFIDPKTRELLDVRRPTLDHIIPRSIKKDNSIYNLVLCCHKCNYEKGARYTYQEFLKLKQGE